jgi:SAM-dependent methyltransferase
VDRRLDPPAQSLAAHYAALLADGDPAHRLGWSDRRQQLTAYEALAGVAELSACSILDAGCGTGDLYAFLRARGWTGPYTGVDLVEGSIAEARARFPEGKWLCGDLLAVPVPVHDYVLACGLFDVAVPDSAERLRTVLRRCWSLCRRGLAWNMFGVRPARAPERQHIEPLDRLLALCAELTPWFVLRNDYAPGHFTVYLYRRAHFVTPALEAVIGRAFLDADFRARLAHDPESVAREYGVTLQQLAVLEPALAVER